MLTRVLINSVMHGKSQSGWMDLPISCSEQVYLLH